MAFDYGDYPSSSLPSELVNVGDGQVAYYQGQAYKVRNNQRGGRILEAPSWNETGVNPTDRLKSPEGQLELADKIQRQQLEFRKQANAPIAQSMKAGIPTLQARYKQILDDLSFRESEESAKTTQRTNVEYGRRGIPLSSGAYSQGLEENLQPTRRFYSGERVKTAVTEQEQLDQINNAIALLEAGNPAESIGNALNLFGGVSSNINNIQARDQQQDQFNRQLEQSMRIAEMQNKGETQSPYLKVGAGESIFDLNTLQSIFTGPYKPTAGAGSGGSNYNQYYNTSNNGGRYTIIGNTG